MGPAWRWMEERYPALTAVLDSARAAKEAFTEATNKLNDAGKRASALNDRISGMEGKADVGMFADIANAQAFNAARAWVEWANGDHDALMFSDAANRRRNAHLQLKAARKWYDELWPSAHKRILGFMGQNIPIEHTYVHGEGHWLIKPPDPKALRTFIRKYGVWPLSVVAMSALPQEAEAQDGKSRASLYGSVVGGMAIGGLLAAMATNRRLRALVKENRELNRAVMMDDLSGLSNKRGHTLAIESIDRDPNTAWIAFDGDRFKTLNDLHGHPEGDKAIQHFGATIRKVADQLGIPQRGFRSGGDEFAMAVPKERAADALRAVEDQSHYTKGGVTTKLTGSIGDVWAEADDALTATKDKNRRADPSLNRAVRPEMEAKLTSEISKALDRVSDPAAKQSVTDLRSGKIDPRVIIGLAGIPLTAFGGVIAGNTAEEKKTNAIIGALTATLGLAGVALAERVLPAIRGALKDDKLPSRDREMVQRVVDKLGTPEQQAAEREGGFRLYSNPIGPALAELKKYPSAAALGLIGYAMTDSDNENVRRAGVPVMALAALSAIGSARSRGQGLPRRSKLVELLRKSPEGTTLTRFFNPDALLTPEVREAIIHVRARAARRERARAVEFSGKAKRSAARAIARCPTCSKARIGKTRRT
jgi:diguanylate cyclase (GGDEF)-like protein